MSTQVTQHRPLHRTSLLGVFRKLKKSKHQSLELKPEQLKEAERKAPRKWLFKKKLTVVLDRMILPPSLDSIRANCELCSISAPRKEFKVLHIADPDPVYICPGCFSLTVETEECQICLEDLPVYLFPVLSLSCAHPARCCKSCLPDYFRSTQRNHGVQFKCPIGGCGVALSFDDIKRLAPQEVFLKHDRQLRRQFLANIPDWIFCSKDGCDFGAEFRNRTRGSYLRCPVCRTHTCAICEVNHEGVTCAQFQRGETADEARREENRRAERWVEDNARGCPGCSRIGVREAGCSHMTCRWCNTEYCWTCLRVYQHWPGYCEDCRDTY